MSKTIGIGNARQSRWHGKCAQAICVTWFLLSTSLAADLVVTENINSTPGSLQKTLRANPLAFDPSMFSAAANPPPNELVRGLLPSSSLRGDAFTTNQVNVGTAVDNISLTSSGPLFTMINTLDTQTPAEQRQSLSQLSGTIFGNTQTIGLQVGDQFQQRLSNRLVSNGQFLTGFTTGPSSNNDLRGQSPANASSAWIQGYGLGGNLKSDGNGAGMNYSQGGSMYGYDFVNDETGMIGIAGGNSYVGFHDGIGAGGQMISYQVGLYALKHNELGYVLGSANYGYDSFGTNRNVAVGGLNQTLRGNYAANQAGTYLESGVKYDAGFVHLQPFVGLQYLYLGQQGFDESGGPAALNVAGSQANSLRANLGGRIVVHQMTGPRGAVWTPYWQGRWVSELLENDRIVNASFNGAPIGGSFTAHGDQIGKNYGIFGKGLQVQLNNRWSLFGNYDAFFGGRINTFTAGGGVVYVW